MAKGPVLTCDCHTAWRADVFFRTATAGTSGSAAQVAAGDSLEQQR